MPTATTVLHAPASASRCARPRRLASVRRRSALGLKNTSGLGHKTAAISPAATEKESMSLDLSKRRKPAFKLPSLTCDAHCHVFGPASHFPYAPNRRYTPEDAPKEMLAALHAHLGIERAVIVQASCHGKDNAAMLDCIASDPKRYRGVAIVDDSFTAADYDALDRGGVRGVRFNFVKHLGGAPDMAVFNRAMDRIKGRGWHVVLHLDAPDIIPLSDMMRKLPLPFVIDHMGRVPAKD